MGAIITRLRRCIAGGIIEDLDLSEDSRKLLEGVDSYTILILSRVADILEGEPYSDTDLKTEEVDLGWKKSGDGGFGDWEKDPPPEAEIQLARELSIPILTEDDVFGSVDGRLTRLLRRENFFPLRDKTIGIESDEVALKLLNELQLLPGQASPTPYHTWDEMSSDEAMSRIFFYGMGSVLLASQSADSKHKDLGPFVVDLELSDLEVRKGYSRYGVRIHFGADQGVTGIFSYPEKKLFKPGDGKGWERAKHLARQNTITVITAREHLLWTHMVLSNTMARVSTEKLPPSHPIRRLLTVFKFRTNYINNSALEVLIPRLSMVHRATAFTIGSIKSLFEAGYKACNIYEPFPDRRISEELKQMSDEGRFPYHSEGVAYYEIVRSFVREWLAKSGNISEDAQAKDFYGEMKASTKGQKFELPPLDSRDAIVNLLTQIIFTVTAYHEMVGTVVDYSQRPSFMGLRSTDLSSSTSTDLQSFLIASVITASTGIRMPFLARPFKNFFGAGGAPKWEIEVWGNFQKKIQKQSEVVKAADASRKYEFKNMDPMRFECAVSV